MKELNLQEIHEAALDILIRFDEICRENGFRYYLAWGTLIGAVRHHGFIPWDDDLDVIMPREDYTKFSAWMKDNRPKYLKLCTRASLENYVYGIPRLGDMRYSYVTEKTNMKPFDVGAFIDIYPMDSCGSTPDEAKRIIKGAEFRTKLYFCYVNPTPNDTQKWKFPIRRLAVLFMKIVKGKNYSQKIDADIQRFIEKYSSNNDRYIGTVVWNDPYNRVFWEREWFEETIWVDFEGHQMPIPQGYHEFLTYIYGDYMEMPPEDKRIPHHDYKLYLKDNDSCSVSGN